MSVAGTWNITMDTPIGTQKFAWTLQESGQGWTGEMSGPMGRSELKGMSVEGDRVKFETRVNTPMGAINLAFQGAVSGDQIAGTCKTMFGDSQFSGTRA